VKPSDHFSSQSVEYSLYRPGYPHKLFEYLATLCPCRELAWDCATGNGQAAIGLAGYFAKVIASDISAEQINKATAHEKIDYRVGSAEHSGIESLCVDLIMVAQALHWFDIESFYVEVRRVLKPQGVLAVVSYQLPRIKPDIDAVTDEFHRDILGEYWPPERCHVDNAYGDIPFPLEEIPSPGLQMLHNWTLDEFLGYLQSWSAVARFEKEKQQSPIDLISMKLGTLWGEFETTQAVQWPLTLRIGKFTGN